MGGPGPGGGRRSRVPKHRRLQGSPPPEPPGWAPTPSPRVPGSPGLGPRARGSRSRSADAAAEERVQSKLCQRRPGRSSRGPAGPGGGALCPEGSLQPARPPEPVPVPGAAPPASPRSGRPPPGADPLGAGAGQPGSPHTSTCAPPSARPAPRSAPPRAAPPPRSCTGPGRYRERRRGSARCRRIVSRRLISRRAPRAPGPGGGPYGTSPSSSRSPPPSGRQVGTRSPRPAPAGWSPRPPESPGPHKCTAHWEGMAGGGLLQPGGRRRGRDASPRPGRPRQAALRRGPGPLRAGNEGSSPPRPARPSPGGCFPGLAQRVQVRPARGGRGGEASHLHRAPWRPALRLGGWSPASAASPADPFL